MRRAEILFTDTQSHTVNNIQTLTQEKTLADLMRRLLKQEAQRLGLEWIDDMPTRQDNARKPRPRKAKET